MIIKIASIKPAKSSYFPCPKGWSSSAGFEDFETEKYARQDALKSAKECSASDKTLILPDKIPAVTLINMRTIFEKIDTAADIFFSFV